MLVLGGLVALGAVALMSGLSSEISLDDADLTPCTQFPTVVHPTRVHLTPGFIEHQSWVEFAVPSQFAGYFAFCLDGRQLSFGGGELDFHTGYARFNVQTRSVDLAWLQGRLNGLQDHERWELRLQCSPEAVCQ